MFFLKLGTSKNRRANIWKVILTIKLLVNGEAYHFGGNYVVCITSEKRTRRGTLSNNTREKINGY